MPIMIRMLLVAALTPLVACSSSGGSDGTGQGLTGALASVSASGEVSKTVSYGDIARLRDLGAIDAAKHSLEPRWSRVVGVGFDRLANITTLLPDAIGLDVYAADRAVSLGEPPNAAVRIDGSIDDSAVSAKLKSLGAKPRSFHGTDGLSFGADNSVDPSSKVSQQLHVVNELDQVVVGPDHFAASPNGAALGAVLGGGDPLADAPHFRDLAACLGDVVVAVLSTPPSPQNSAVIAVGIRDPGSLDKDHEEVVCSAPADGKQQSVQAAFTKNFALDALDARTHAPLSTYASAVHVDTPSGTVRAVLTVKADKTAGYVLSAYHSGAATSWDGSS